jgi:hypothetical protein
VQGFDGGDGGLLQRRWRLLWLLPTVPTWR